MVRLENVIYWKSKNLWYSKATSGGKTEVTFRMECVWNPITPLIVSSSVAGLQWSYKPTYAVYFRLCSSLRSARE